CCQCYASIVRVRCGGRSRPKLAGSVLRLLREAVHISCQQVHLIIAQDVFLGGHTAVTTIAQGLLDLAKARTVKPDIVCQIGCAHGLGALTFSAVTGYTGRGEDLLTLLNVDVDAFWRFAA